MSSIGPTISPPMPAFVQSDRDKALFRTARDLEQVFLAEMLKSTGFGDARQSFGGGEGEDQFASFLQQEHARAFANAGGIGLAESLFHAMKGRHDGAI